MMMLDNTNIKKVLHVQLTMKMIEMGKMLRRAMNIFFHLGSLEHWNSRSSVWNQIIERGEGRTIL